VIKASDVRELTDQEIAERIAELQSERFRLRFRSATQQLENPMLLRHIRKDIARLMTEQRARELASKGSR
jgi:large subunit ribosomal protein L29